MYIRFYSECEIPNCKENLNIKDINKNNWNITAEEETVSIENEHILAESTIEQEKSKTEELEQEIRALEERLVQGGGGAGKDLLNNLNESQIILEQRNLEIAERRKREVEMQQKIDLEEETTAIVTNTFATLQQEVDHKTQRYIRSNMVETKTLIDLYY